MKITITPLANPKFAPGVYRAGNRASKWAALTDSELVRASLTSMIPLTNSATMGTDGVRINEILAAMQSPLRLTALQINAGGFITAAVFEPL